MPQKNRFLQTDFTRGEMDRKFDGRTEIEAYFHGVSYLRNFITMRQGGITKAPGTTHIRNAISNDHNSVLYAADMGPGERYMLELSNQSMSVYKDGARVHSGVVHPYLAADLYNLQMVKIDNKIYIACAGYKVQVLTYTSETVWGFADAVFKATSVDFTTVATRYPRGIAYHEQRIILFGTPEKPATVWGSAVPAIDAGELDFILGVNDADAWEYRLASAENEDLLWAVSKDVLFIGTRQGEHILTGHGEGITPSNVYTAKQTPFGSEGLAGILVDDAVIFAQRGGRVLREQFFLNDQQAYRSPEITFFSGHILSGGVRQIALQRNPDPILWMVTGDGRLVGMTYDRTLGITGFHSQETEGEVESVGVVSEGAEDRLYASVRRYINGAWVRHIELVELRDMAEPDLHVFSHDAQVIDMGDARVITGITKANPAVVTSAAHSLSNGAVIRIDGVQGMPEVNANQYTVANAGANTFELRDETDSVNIDSTEWGEYDSGGHALPVIALVDTLAYLEGETVAVLADGAPHATKDVFNGSILLDGWYNRVVVGLPYTASCRLMRIGQSDVKRIHKLFIRFLDTLGCRVGPSPNMTQEIVWHQIGGDLTTAPELFSGDKEQLFPGIYDRDGYVWIIQDTPTPITVLSVVADMATYGGG